MKTLMWLGVIVWIVLLIFMFVGCATPRLVLMCVPSTFEFAEADATAQGLTCADPKTMAEMIKQQRPSSPSPSQFTVPSPPRYTY